MGIATVAAAIGGLLTGLAAMITAVIALRTAQRRADAPAPVPVPKADAPAPKPVPSPARHGEAVLSWSLGLSMFAWLLSIVVVILAGVGTVPLNGAPVRTLEWGTIALAVLAIGSGGLSFQQSIAAGPRQGTLLRIGAGTAVAAAALAATLIAGS
jgi:hypothetical protein